MSLYCTPSGLTWESALYHLKYSHFSHYFAEFKAIENINYSTLSPLKLNKTMIIKSIFEPILARLSLF